MSQDAVAKRKRSAADSHNDAESNEKKRKRGFVVGPDNLPDGAWKRKNQKTKAKLIDQAQIKKNYAKLKRQGKIPTDDAPLLDPEAPNNEYAEQDEPSTAPHPDRQVLMDNEAASPLPEQPQSDRRPRQRKPKPIPFKREYEQAQQRKAAAEERARAKEEGEKQRQRKLEERDQMRKSMNKARRLGPDGQRKLGRESKVLLKRVKRLVEQGG